ncbi:MAG: M28 family metallopeptidase [Rhodothermales bacterium]
MKNWNQVIAGALFLAGLLLFGCTSDPRTPALESITTEYLAAAIETLASDAFEGRGPSSEGEERTIAFLRDEFQRIGLEPGNGDSFFQEVPLVAITAQGAPALTVSGGGATTALAFGDDQVVWTKRVVEQSALENSDLVFVGYGVVAPEYDWNDYEGVDVRGKTVVILVNDPGFATQDEALFNGNAMTYYGRWTYKYEEAARQGAAGALVIHDMAPAGYGWGTVRSSWTGPQFDLVSDDGNMSRVAVEGWITLDAAQQLFAQARQDLDALRARAAQRGFEAVPLGLQASVSITNTLERSTSNNVLAVWPGSDRADEYVVYMGHWDHLGRDAGLEGDQIYNGALDNATGTAGLLELAEAYTRLGERPSRSILFLAVTAEEQGLLGSAYYATHPVYPLNKTVAAINMDVLNHLGPMNDITVVGYGNSELDDYLEEAAAEAGRVVRSDPEPEKGFYYRSDHFSFAKEGIPALYTDAGIDHVEYGEAWTLEQREEYTAHNYHKPSDEYDPNWDLTGAVDDLELLFTVGYRLATSAAFPNWREGTEFKARRDATMAE